MPVFRFKSPCPERQRRAKFPDSFTVMSEEVVLIKQAIKIQLKLHNREENHFSQITPHPPTAPSFLLFYFFQ